MAELSKESMRIEAIRHRDRIRVYENEDPELACHHFFEAVRPQPGQVCALYWPKENEFDPRSILERLLAEGFTCTLPVVRGEEKILSFARWQDGQPLQAGAFGVEQPVVDEGTVWVDPDIVVVPLLAFDRRGYRLGYGGGYYDATLRALRHKKKITAVGVGFAQQAVLFNLPVEEHDEKLDWIVTPKAAQYFGKG